ncbi:MAG: hypothetical protein ACR2PS_04420 [Pseudomonadales bacterium]
MIRLLEIIRAMEFREAVLCLPGYSPDDSGDIVTITDVFSL